MTWLVHLSDIHLLADPARQDVIFESLARALAEVRREIGTPPDLVAMTGDIFDSSTLDVRKAMAEFDKRYSAIREALGTTRPAVILPGNHDRRQEGVIGPHSHDLFRELARMTGDSAVVHGTDPRTLVAVIDGAAHGLRARVAAYDSTFLASGRFSAGGTLDQQALLSIAAEVENDPEDRPLLVLIHHHLIPTPLTDMARIIVEGQPFWVRFAVEKALPYLVSNSDRQELTMTALGAGTALTSLHAFGRPILVLHGHKHYATARLLSATASEDGDVLLTAAGSAGLSEKWSSTAHEASPHLWPSFNIIQFEDDVVTVETIWFPHRSLREPIRRGILARVRQRGRHWEPQSVPALTPNARAVLQSNRAEYRITPNGLRGDARWDIIGRRVLLAGEAWREGESYVDILEGAPGATLEAFEGGPPPASAKLPAKILLGPSSEARFRLVGGACRTYEEATKVYGEPSPYEWVSLLNRHACHEAVLTFSAPKGTSRPFGSVTDLGTGRERPIRLVEKDGQFILSCAPCPERTLLRIVWALE